MLRAERERSKNCFRIRSRQFGNSLIFLPRLCTGILESSSVQADVEAGVEAGVGAGADVGVEAVELAARSLSQQMAFPVFHENNGHYLTLANGFELFFVPS